MPQFPNSIKKLIDLFSKFPTVGPRTASRFVFYLIKQPKEKTEEIIMALQDLKGRIRYCAFCFNPFEAASEKLCEICRNNARDKSTLCIVEKETDLNTIENTGKYKGLYFILGGNVSALKKTDLEKIRGQELGKRLHSPQTAGISTTFKEIIVATNPTPEGKATAFVIERIIKEIFKDQVPKITHLGLGLPIGGELEYADDETLENAFKNRK